MDYDLFNQYPRLVSTFHFFHLSHLAFSFLSSDDQTLKVHIGKTLMYSLEREPNSF